MAVTTRGDKAHDAVDGGNPVKIGGKAASVASLPTAVSAGDRVDAAFDLNGRMIVAPDGNVAADAADVGRPVKIGGVAAAPGTPQTAVSAAGDRVDAAFDLNGRQHVVPLGPGAHQTRTVTTSADMQVAAAISPAPAAGKKLIVDELFISTPAAEIVTLTEETSGTVVGVVHTAAGGVSRVSLGQLNTAAKRLFASLASAGDVSFILLSRAE